MKKSNSIEIGLKLGIPLLFLVLNFQLSHAQQCINAGSSTDQLTNESAAQQSSSTAPMPSELYYKLWTGKGSGSLTIGNACMTIGDGFLFSSNWTSTDNTLARRGYKYNESQTHSQLGHYTLAYNCNYQPTCTSGNSYLAVYGWTSNGSQGNLVEYYIIENWCNWNPSMETTGKTNMGTISVNGADYDLFKVTKTGKPSIYNSSDNFVQYFSVRKTTRSSGTIDISEHFKQWENKGMPLGKFYEITMVVEGYQNSGSASFSKLDFGYSVGPGQENNATSVSFGQSSYSVAQGASTGSLLGGWLPAGSTLSNVYFVSSNPSVASIGVYKGYYFVHGESQGTATLTLMSGTTPNTTATVTVTSGSGGGGGASAKKVVVNAQGTTGTEQIALLVNGSPMNVITLSKNMQSYNSTVAGSGDVKVEFLNDDGKINGRDVRLDFISVDGVKRETESMAQNGSVYQNGTCGGSYSELLNCNGAVNYGPLATPHSITIRARGTQGNEHINLLINGNAVNTGWALTTSFQEYKANITGDGDINVQYDNDYGDYRDVVVDWLKVDNQNVRQAENMQYNTAFYANGRCGGGSYSEWMNCNGVIGFGKISDDFKSTSPIQNESGFIKATIYPNPSSGDITIELNDIESVTGIKIYNLSGKTVYMNTEITEKLINVYNLKEGIYILNIESNGNSFNEKLIVL